MRGGLGLGLGLGSVTLTLTLSQTLTLPQALTLTLTLALALTLTLILTRMRALRALYDSVIGLLCAQLDTPPPSELVASEATEGGGVSAAPEAALRALGALHPQMLIDLLWSARVRLG